MNPQQPNILWIVMDTVRADHLSCYGYPRRTTPFLEELARESTVYKNAISPSSRTIPSHASMMTGLFPSKHGADGNWWWLDNQSTTIAKLLRSHGYHTALFTNNLLVSSITNIDQGFEKSFYFSPKEKSRDGSNTRWSQEVRKLFLKLYRRFLQPHSSRLSLSSFQEFEQGIGAAATNQILKGYLKKITYPKPFPRPFFIFVNYMEAHYPYGNTPLGHFYLKEDKVLPEKAKELSKRLCNQLFEYLFEIQLVNPAEAKIIQDLYDGDILYLDSQLRDLTSFLKNKEVLDKTILIITSDHGECLGERYTIGHGKGLSHNLLHVPLLIRYPPAFMPGCVENRYVQTTDIFPTLLDLLSIHDFPREVLQGFSLLKTSDRYPFAISEGSLGITNFEFVAPLFQKITRQTFQRLFSQYKSVYHQGYKYVWAPDSEYLYHIEQDPHENIDLAEKEPDRARELRNILSTWLDGFEPYWKTFHPHP